MDRLHAERDRWRERALSAEREIEEGKAAIWLRAPVGPDVTVEVRMFGRAGLADLDRLIGYLELTRRAFAEDEAAGEFRRVAAR